MKIKIGNKIYHSDDEPVAVILTEFEKQWIVKSEGQQLTFCKCPPGMSLEDGIKFAEDV